MTLVKINGVGAGRSSISASDTEELITEVAPERISIAFDIIIRKSQRYKRLIISAYGQTSAPHPVHLSSISSTISSPVFNQLFLSSKASDSSLSKMCISSNIDHYILDIVSCLPRNSGCLSNLFIFLMIYLRLV